MSKLIPFVLFTLTIAGCNAEKDLAKVQSSGSDAAKTEALTDADHALDIQWFAGTVEEAFIAARESGKPIFLYWGAEWCPPCHAIKATVFQSPEFIERSKLFVPVYLDGDEQNAQAYGEKFGVLGYPTMVVFNSGGEEITRIPSGIDIQAYANVLDLTLSNSSTAADIVRSLMGGAQAGENLSISASDCTLLAFNSWGQNTRILEDYDEVELFEQMYNACPENMPVERSVLYFSWLEKALDRAEDEENPQPLSAAQRADALQHTKDLLADSALIRANIFTVLFSGAKLTEGLTDAGSEARAELVTSFDQVFDVLAADETLYKRERIYTLIGKIEFERIDDKEAEVSDALKDEIRERMVWADQSTPSVYDRQPIINAVANVLDEAGMYDLAKPLLIAELERSQQPYYFMPALADIEQRAGNDEAAKGWLKKGYDEARGSATRFQWGYYYLSGLLEMSPTDYELIQNTTVGMIAELQQSNGFYHRPKAHLGRLQSDLMKWGESDENREALHSIRQSVLEICTQVPEADGERVACESFLESV